MYLIRWLFIILRSMFKSYKPQMRHRCPETKFRIEFLIFTMRFVRVNF